MPWVLAGRIGSQACCEKLAPPPALSSCEKPGLLKGLEAIAEDLELCEKALNDFLEAKRTFFPRFYFVSQTMLLDILSNGNRPWVVLKNVNAMMQGVKECQMKGDPFQSLFVKLLNLSIYLDD